MMLVRDLPASALLAQSNSQPQAGRSILLQFLLRAAAQHCGRKRNIVSGCDIERHDVERSVTLPLPLEKRRPGCPIGIDALHDNRRRHVEHHHVVGMSGQNTIDVPGRPPARCQRRNGQCRQRREIKAIVIRRRSPSPLEKYLGEVRLKRFEIGRLAAEADIAVGTDYIQTCTPSSIAVV
jgi:hypothetical protein